MEITDLEKRTALSLLLPTLSGRPTAAQAAKAKADIVAARGTLKYNLDIKIQRLFEGGDVYMSEKLVTDWTGVNMQDGC